MSSCSTGGCPQGAKSASPRRSKDRMDQCAQVRLPRSNQAVPEAALKVILKTTLVNTPGETMLPAIFMKPCVPTVKFSVLLVTAAAPLKSDTVSRYCAPTGTALARLHKEKARSSPAMPFFRIVSIAVFVALLPTSLSEHSPVFLTVQSRLSV